MSKRKVKVKTSIPRVSEKKLKTMAKIIKILSYTGSLIFLASGIYMFMLPGGWIVGICLLVASVIIAIEARRVIKT